MGGKDTIVVDADADVDAAVEGVTAAAFGFQGQKCSACSRAVVDAKIYDQFLEKLKATPDGDGSLLDHTLYLYGSGMSNGDKHDHTNLPILVAGGGSGKGRRHIRYDKPTPLANLHLTLLDKAGVRLDSFADSNGKIPGLLEPLAL